MLVKRETFTGANNCKKNLITAGVQTSGRGDTIQRIRRGNPENQREGKNPELPMSKKNTKEGDGKRGSQLLKEMPKARPMDQLGKFVGLGKSLKWTLKIMDKGRCGDLKTDELREGG